MSQATQAMAQQIVRTQARVQDVRDVRRGCVVWPRVQTQGFNGLVKLNGRLITNGGVGQPNAPINADASKPWARFILASRTASEELGPANNDGYDGEMWVEKAHINGTWYIWR